VTLWRSASAPLCLFHHCAGLEDPRHLLGVHTTEAVLDVRIGRRRGRVAGMPGCQLPGIVTEGVRPLAVERQGGAPLLQYGDREGQATESAAAAGLRDVVRPAASPSTPPNWTGPWVTWPGTSATAPRSSPIDCPHVRRAPAAAGRLRHRRPGAAGRLPIPSAGAAAPAAMQDALLQTVAAVGATELDRTVSTPSTGGSAWLTCSTSCRDTRAITPSSWPPDSDDRAMDGRGALITAVSREWRSLASSPDGWWATVPRRDADASLPRLTPDS